MKTNEQLVHVFWWECCDIHILSGSHCLHEDMRSSATTSLLTAVVEQSGEGRDEVTQTGEECL